MVRSTKIKNFYTVKNGTNSKKRLSCDFSSFTYKTFLLKRASYEYWIRLVITFYDNPLYSKLHSSPRGNVNFINKILIQTNMIWISCIHGMMRPSPTAQINITSTWIFGFKIRIIYRVNNENEGLQSPWLTDILQWRIIKPREEAMDPLRIVSHSTII